jgi:ABC-type Fe3+/spermidine/putrescine transport system ATPase subunit
MFLEVANLKKSFGAEKVLEDVSFGLEQEETLGILGRSGSGKTTLLKILAGLEEADAGGIGLGGEAIERREARLRGVVYLYQEPLLFPHLDVYENVAFGLRLRGEGEAAISARVGEMLERLGLAEQARKRPHQLSGGQRQRVSFGRALVVDPRLLLLDEPFASLDFETREGMQSLFKEVAAACRSTAIFVTHDLKEAILMSRRIALLRGGKLRVYASLDEVLADPLLGARRELEFWRSLGAG